jgi:hypothetical protein
MKKEKSENEKLIEASLLSLDIKELYELGQRVTDKYDDIDPSLYKFFHDYTIKYMDEKE